MNTCCVTVWRNMVNHKPCSVAEAQYLDPMHTSAAKATSLSKTNTSVSYKRLHQTNPVKIDKYGGCSAPKNGISDNMPGTQQSKRTLRKRIYDRKEQKRELQQNQSKQHICHQLQQTPQHWQAREFPQTLHQHCDYPQTPHQHRDFPQTPHQQESD